MKPDAHYSTRSPVIILGDPDISDSVDHLILLLEKRASEENLVFEIHEPVQGAACEEFVRRSQPYYAAFLYPNLVDCSAADISYAVRIGNAFYIAVRAGSNTYIGTGPGAILRMRAFCHSKGIQLLYKETNFNNWIQDQAGFMPEEMKLNESVMPTKRTKIFVSYSWEPGHKETVLSFVDHLRQSGFDAEIDELLLQKNTALDFVKMMHQAMVSYDKIIIVLSKSYKEKAEEFKGGVGEEYSLIIKDIQSYPQKYILVSFDGIRDDIVPLGLKAREIVDTQSKDWQTKLFAKLLDAPLIQFAPVGSSLPKIEPLVPSPFEPLMKRKNALEVVRIHAKEISGGWRQYGLYRSVYNVCEVEVKNGGDETVTDVVVEWTVPKTMFEKQRNKDVPYDQYDDVITLSFPVKKMYPDQKVKTPSVTVCISNQTIEEMVDAHFSVRVFSDGGTAEKQIPIKDFFAVTAKYNQAAVLSKELFLDAHL